MAKPPMAPLTAEAVREAAEKLKQDHASPGLLAATLSAAAANVTPNIVTGATNAFYTSTTSGHSHQINTAANTNQISFGNVQPAQFHKCETCGAMLNAWDPSDIDLHMEWHRRMEPLMKLLTSQVGQDAVLKTLKGDLQKLLDGLS